MASNKLRTILKTTALLTISCRENSYAGDGLPNNSIRPDAHPKTIDISADFLYWYTGETVDWAFTLSQNQNSVQTFYKTLVFDWAPGFRIGLGYNMEHDKWDTQASYTWFQSKASSHTTGAVTAAFFAARLSLLEPFSTGKARLNLHYNMFDWDLGRSFLLSKHLNLRPSIGLKGGWINQDLHSYWTKPLISASETINQSFQGGGPKGGVTTKWCFGNILKHSFSLIGQFETAYLWGHWSIKDKYIDNLLTEIYIKTLDRNFGSFVIRSFLGFGWDCNYDHNRSHFGLKIGYEIEDWLNQFQVFTDFSGGQNSDLILQGLNLSVRFDF